MASSTPPAVSSAKAGGQGVATMGPGQQRVFPMSLGESGPLGLNVRAQGPDKWTVVLSVAPGSQSARAGIAPGDRICVPGTNGRVGMAFRTFLDLAKSASVTGRPVEFDVGRGGESGPAPPHALQNGAAAAGAGAPAAVAVAAAAVLTKPAAAALPAMKPAAPKKMPGAFVDLTNSKSCVKPATAKKPPAAKARKPAKKPSPKAKKESSSKSSSSSSTGVIYEAAPEPGYVCSTAQFYSTLNNETTSSVADKLGCEWRALSDLPDNKRYGTLRANSAFKTGTLLRIPAAHSKWKIKGLRPKDAELEAAGAPTKCCSCEKVEVGAAAEAMLLCDGCDAPCHLGCTHDGLEEVPSGDWFCRPCVVILRARAERYGRCGKGSLRAELPALSEREVTDEEVRLEMRLGSHLQDRRREALEAVVQTAGAMRAALREKIDSFPHRLERAEAEVKASDKLYREKMCQKLSRFPSLLGFGGVDDDNPKKSTLYIDVADKRRGRVRLYKKDEMKPKRGHYYWSPPTYTASEAWKKAYKSRAKLLKDAEVVAARREVASKREHHERLMVELSEAKGELKNLDVMECDQRVEIQIEYAALLGETRHESERERDFKNREPAPRLLGQITLADERDVHAMNLLCEPDELVILLPKAKLKTDGDESSGQRAMLWAGASYAVFARAALFDPRRDDETPIDPCGIRGSQRRLAALLRENPTYSSALVYDPKLPSSVRARDVSDNGSSSGDILHLFDLSELVRDCNCPLDLPQEETPEKMARNGLQLRSYQKASLKWMLDKERDATGMGIAGEMWSRHRFLGSMAGQDYFYCDLTGTFSLDIFNFRSDANQHDAAVNFGGMPKGGILGEEMGLGKTVECLALIVANPPPLHDRMLPREHIWSLERHVVDYSEYVSPPSAVGAFSNVKNVLLSNGTLLIVPMTLMSQWQSEIERYTPWLSVMTLHNQENPKIQNLASTDIVIVSTWLLQRAGTGGTQAMQASRLLGLVRKIHWHRIFVDESHYNQVGVKTKTTLASFSASNRFCVTGTPVGHSLDDLQGQLRFLRVPSCTRLGFWENCISTPYCERSLPALNVLRALLSRVVVRHSKEQTLADGNALVALPPRTVETELIPFGSKHEEHLYRSLEKRNRDYFESLRNQSHATVLGHYIELNGLMYSARQACSHISMIDLSKLDNFNRNTDPRYKKSAILTSKTVKGQATRSSILKEAVEKAKPSAETRVRALLHKIQDEAALMECPVCLEPVGEVDVTVTPCGHAFCNECILSIMDSASRSREASGKCPQCRTVVNRSELTLLGDASDAGKKTEQSGGSENDQDETPITSDVNGFQITSKEVHVAAEARSSTLRVGRSLVKESREDIQERRQYDAAHLPTLTAEFISNYDACEKRIGSKVGRLLNEIDIMAKKDPTSKCVVFSQFLGVLDIASEELAARGIRHVRVDGHKKQHERADALLDFSSDPGVKVFLLSMRAGAVGLTLTAADHCFILDTPQNSAVEEQAIDRIHRIGQTRPVTVKRFVMAGTVEERILQVRRSLAADRPSAGSQLCDSILFSSDADDGANAMRPAKRARTSDDEPLGEFGSERQQQRLQTLATIFGCSAVLNVFKP